MSRNRRLSLSLLALLALAAFAVGSAGCGHESHETEVSEGEPLKLGELTFNVTFSRYLNPNDTDDSAYLVGEELPPPGSTYFGVFFEVQNESDKPQKLPPTLKVTDAEHTTYDVFVNDGLYAFPLGGEVEAEEQIPVLDSTAQLGPIEGSVALFLLPEEASENRPLTLHITGADGHDGEVTLDL